MAEFRTLGRIEVVADGHRLDVGHARRQAVLAVLLTELNRVVPIDQLVERVWGEAPAPRDPRGVLRTYLWHLRRAFADLRDVALVRRAPGYELAADERQVDLHRFRGLLARTHTADDDDRRAALLEQALALWRGEPFAGLDSPWIDLTRRNLQLRHHMARLDLTDIDLRRGRHTMLLSELTGQTAEHPLDERIAGQLMLALHRSGRSADAFAEYQRIRCRLADELGADPGPALRGVHQQILTTGTVHARATGTVHARDAPGGTEVRAPSTGPAAPDDPMKAPTGATTPALRHPRIPVPRQLPAAPRSFTGRVRELDALDATLEERSGPGRVLIISGLGGVGKTWLALHWAQQNLDRFPDGQLYADMRGFTHSGPPASPRTAIHAFLHALGAAPANVPAHVHARVGHYRSLLADRRMLIVLDNVRDAEQVVPLLPGSGACTVLVTGRHRLTGLITGHGAHHLALDVLPEDDARLLLARRLGRDRADAEPSAVASTIAYCAGLPLALAVAATRAALQPDRPLGLIADELRNPATRLDALTTGDPSADVRSVLRSSYDALDPETAGALSLLASAPGADIDLPAAAGLLTGCSQPAVLLLRALENASLLRQHAQDRYRMHDLVRLYAAARGRRHRGRPTGG